MLCLAAFSGSAANANPVGLSKAQAIAKAWLKGKKLELVETNEARSRMGEVSVEQPAFYVFNAENNGGFIIISADDAVSPVIGYSHSGSFNLGNMPPYLQKCLARSSERVRDLQSSESLATRAADDAESAELPEPTIIVDALCKTTWGQSTPFNYFCPRIGGQETPCGCVATATAQIMKYWKWPESGRGSIMYNSSGYGVISRDFSQSTYDWDVMQDKGGLIRNKQVREAMATICYDVGLSVKMTYAPSGSGAFDEDIRISLPKYFKYKASTIDLMRRECFESHEAWMNAIKREFKAGRPMVCCASDSSLTTGHAFVVDGYDSNDFVHVNWGWDGMSDGFYDVELLAPRDTRYQFSESQTMLAGIMPDKTEEDCVVKQYKMYLGKAPDCEGTVNVGDEFIVTYYSLSYLGNGSTFYTAGVGLFDADGNFLKEISVESPSITTSYTQQYKSWYTLTGLRVAAKIEKGSVPDGKYAIRAVFQEKGFTDWALPDMVGGSQLNWIPVVIKNGKMTLRAADGPSAPNAITDVETETPEVVSTSFYDLQGRKLSIPAKGTIVIKREKLGDGSSKAYKVFMK